MAAGPGLLAAGGQLLSRHRTAVLCAAALGVGLAAAWLWKSRRRSRRERRQVGVVSQLFIYPVKSFRGVALEEAECTKLGLKHGELRDRHWLVTTENGGMVTARQEPKLVLISVSCDGAFLTLKAPEMEELRIPLKLPRTNPVLNCRVHGHNVQGKDCGDETARWISAFVQSTEPYRLVHFENHMKLRNSKEEFALYHRNDQTVYADLAPLLLLSEASLDDLNTRLDKKVKIQNFRPCVVVSGCTAFEEDSWDEVMIGDVELNRVMACHRCIFTTLDPDTGIINIKEPLETLRTYRLCETADKVHYKKSPLFGQYFGIGKTGRIKVGDPVYMIVS
ncbi:mitochondrial amidoxime-reducing component 1-like isoform X1 [Lissotriton helveticus]